MKKRSGLVALALMGFLLATSCSLIYSPLVWSDIVLSDRLPDPGDYTAQIIENTQGSLNINIHEFPVDECVSYAEKCANEYGFSIDAISEGNSFKAKHEDGFTLEISYDTIFKDLCIKLYLPAEDDESSMEVPGDNSEIHDSSNPKPDNSVSPPATENSKDESTNETSKEVSEEETETPPTEETSKPAQNNNSIPDEISEPPHNNTSTPNETSKEDDKQEKPENNTSKEEASSPETSENSDDPDASTNNDNLVWIPTKGGTKYHRSEDCSNMNGPRQVTIEEAEALGYSPCKKCYG